MALHKDFPKSPYEILDPEIRWFPADEDLRKKGYGKLLWKNYFSLPHFFNAKCISVYGVRGPKHKKIPLL